MHTFAVHREVHVLGHLLDAFRNFRIVDFDPGVLRLALPLVLECLVIDARRERALHWHERNWLLLITKRT